MSTDREAPAPSRKDRPKSLRQAEGELGGLSAKHARALVAEAIATMKFGTRTDLTSYDVKSSSIEAARTPLKCCKWHRPRGWCLYHRVSSAAMGLDINIIPLFRVNVEVVAVIDLTIRVIIGLSIIVNGSRLFVTPLLSVSSIECLLSTLTSGRRQAVTADRLILFEVPGLASRRRSLSPVREVPA